MRSQSYRRLVLVQKYDCKCFYRTSQTNKRAKSSSAKRVRVAAKKEIDGWYTDGEGYDIGPLPDVVRPV